MEANGGTISKKDYFFARSFYINADSEIASLFF